MKVITNFFRIIIFCFCILTVTLLCGCGAIQSTRVQDGKVRILCAGFSQFDWVLNIISGSDKAEAVSLYKSGVDIHSFQASAADIVSIADSDLFVFNGGSSDKALLDIMEKSTNKSHVTFDCMERLGSSILDEDESVAPENSHYHETEEEADEHIWLSLKNAAVLCRSLAEEISKLDPQNANLYHNNADKYISKLNKLDEDYSETISASQRKQLVFADRFPFRYLASDYGLECFAAFPGCSTETEAAFSTILYLAEKVGEFKLPYIITVDNAQNSIGKAVIDSSQNKNVKILSMNSLQTVTDEQKNNGLTYLSAMEDNLKTIRDALN